MFAKSAEVTRLVLLTCIVFEECMTLPILPELQTEITSSKNQYQLKDFEIKPAMQQRMPWFVYDNDDNYHKYDGEQNHQFHVHQSLPLQELPNEKSPSVYKNQFALLKNFEKLSEIKPKIISFGDHKLNTERKYELVPLFDLPQFDEQTVLEPEKKTLPFLEDQFILPKNLAEHVEVKPEVISLYESPKDYYELHTEGIHQLPMQKAHEENVPKLEKEWSMDDDDDDNEFYTRQNRRVYPLKLLNYLRRTPTPLELKKKSPPVSENQPESKNSEELVKAKPMTTLTLSHESSEDYHKESPSVPEEKNPESKGNGNLLCGKYRKDLFFE